MKLKLHTTAEMQTELHHLANTRGKTVRVPKQALVNLLIDHGKLCDRAGLSNIEESTP